MAEITPELMQKALAEYQTNTQEQKAAYDAEMRGLVQKANASQQKMSSLQIAQAKQSNPTGIVGLTPDETARYAYLVAAQEGPRQSVSSKFHLPEIAIAAITAATAAAAGGAFAGAGGATGAGASTAPTITLAPTTVSASGAGAGCACGGR